MNEKEVRQELLSQIQEALESVLVADELDEAERLSILHGAHELLEDGKKEVRVWRDLKNRSS